MFVLFATISLASLLGSLHCAGMCGAFVAFATGAGQPGGPSRLALQTAYHLGRLAVYVALGVLAGFLGHALDLTGSMLGIQRAAAIAAGGIMVLFGLLTLAQLAGYRVRQRFAPKALESLLGAGHRMALALPPLPRAGLIGLLTTLLPCGWLWAFVITAAGTAHPLTAAGAMAAFWLGTVPMLAAIGVGVQQLLGRAFHGHLAGKLPTLAAMAIVVVGLYSILTRLHAAPAVAAMTAPPSSSATQRLDHAAHTLPPCCQGKEHTP